MFFKNKTKNKKNLTTAQVNKKIVIKSIVGSDQLARRWCQGDERQARLRLLQV